MQAPLWIMAGVSAAIVGIAALADRRRVHRSRLDAVGWMPWPFILLMATMIAAICTALALRE